MAYRNGTYVAFDGMGQVNPTQSDFRYYGILKGWNESGGMPVHFNDSHAKTYAVRDDSLNETLKNRILERLRHSKNMIVILSDDTRKRGSMLSYEIEKAVDQYQLPLIIAHTGYRVIAAPSTDALQRRWPTALRHRIDDETAQAIHIPFKWEPISYAIGQFSVNGTKLNGSTCYYSAQDHRVWKLLCPGERFGNIKA